MDADVFQFTIRVLCALAAGFLIGIEREFKNKHAGLKTNTLVSLGAAVFVLISLRFYGDDYTDITRVVSQVAIGVGFLGAGTIMKRGENVHGLTTAATIWCSAGAGSLAAFGMYWELLILTVLVVLINFVFGKIDDKISKNASEEN
ncbi:MgtC/SapB family protein [Cochleicola gelatinilyticus]|uniref:Magnesium transporter MgtC n=1 Tax=Cochleicola gelatinilyticus TaxID=1763537 RepID=A0A167IUM5_9FLAO|nr:MgtC/SapB family protein [Cochleicola gelatinilyticus]OAB80031.1 magnesium transporter MgtC [Cochleicola gelatinilyticus]